MCNSVDSSAVTDVQRIQSLDVLRGIALGGILVMNISSFALPGTAYSNPTAFGDDSPLNHLIFSLSHVFFDQKMMGLFSMLFGASALLFMEKLRDKNLGAAKYYYSRIFWLTLIGFLHGTFLWEGDILFFYGLCGFILFFFQYLPPLLNFVIGVGLFFIAIAVGEYGQHWINNLTPQELDYYSWAWQPSERDIAGEIDLRMESYRSLLFYRWETSELNPSYTTSFITKVFIAQGLSRAFGMMLIGVALYQWKIFSSAGSRIGGYLLLAIGTIIVSAGLISQYQENWAIEYSLYHGRFYNHLSTPFLVLAYTLLIINFTHRTPVTIFQKAIANYGRMAFSNYLIQTVICTFLFYGYGKGLFAQFDRWQLMLIVLLIIVAQILFSNLWLRFFYYGPLEWLWRMLTFFRIPSRKQ